jgi:DNA polymerase-1
MLEAMPRLFLIDSFGYIFRAYYARMRMNAPPMRTSAGVPTEAVFIFHNMLKKLREKYKPDYLAAVYESLGPTFRETEFAAYKANRTETPPDLIAQVPLVKRLLESLRIPVLEFDSFEADDVIGTLAKRAQAAGLEVVIVSSDKDMLQLVGPGISMLNPAKDDTIYDRDKVKEFMGVWPEQVADLLALKGDAVDNIPGAPGIGDKGAVALLEQYGTLDNLLAEGPNLTKKAYREALTTHREQVELSKRLATIHCEVPLDLQLVSLAMVDPDRPALEAFYREMEFFSFLRDLAPEPEKIDEDYAAISAEELPAWAGPGPVGVALFDGQLGVARAPGVARACPSLSFLQSDSPKIAHDLKALYAADPGARHLTRDLLLEAFLLTADSGNAAFDALCEVHLHQKPGARADQRADLTLRLAEKLGPEIDKIGAREIYESIDLPLVPVLAAMERVGVLIEPQQLAVMSAKMDTAIQALTKEIHGLAGREFNINSPQQLGKVLFEDLNLPAPTKGGKKQISTAADVLEGLAHPIAAQVLEYRGLVKLKGTYVDALPALIRPETGRVHTTFQQTGAATGRLSSSNPNLQNIPVRTELGREIRAAFIPPPGWKLVVADYSQIELRLLAHMSGDPVLVDAFQHGEDIHTRTAAEVFGVNAAFVTPEMRRGAKAVNFGIVYGQTAFGLASALGIPKHEAEKYIKAYFARYSGVKTFIETTIAEVRAKGYAETLFGRRRPIPDMDSRNPNARSFAERTAVNTPLQGSAADLIKLAMIRIHKLLAEQKLAARMILQVHDELVFEAPPDEVLTLTRLVKHEMESVRQFAVPLVVDTGVGDNWRDAK